jgi:Tol biopolymer transport system component
VIYGVRYALYLVDLPSRAKTLIETNSWSSFKDFVLSADGRLLVCTKPPLTNGFAQVYLYDLESRTNLLVSASLNGQQPGNNRSDAPDISPDGRYIAFRSEATDLVTTQVRGASDIYLYDVQARTCTLLTRSRSSGTGPDNRSMNPTFAANGKLLFFQSYASDLSAFDFNTSSDIFTYSFLYALILPAAAPAQGPWISWPLQQGREYQLEYKNNLTDAEWQQLPGIFTNSGSRAWGQDLSPNPSQRFYRVRAF